jgi:hypothetical protein
LPGRDTQTLVLVPVDRGGRQYRLAGRFSSTASGAGRESGHGRQRECRMPASEMRSSKVVAKLSSLETRSVSNRRTGGIDRSR